MTKIAQDFAAELARQLHCDEHDLEIYIRPAFRKHAEAQAKKILKDMKIINPEIY